MSDRSDADGDGAPLNPVDRFLDRVIHYFSYIAGAVRAPDVDKDTTLTRLDRVLDGLLYGFAAVLLIVIALAVFYSVFARYALKLPPLWAEEAPIVFFLWMTFAALAVATRRGENIKVTFFIERFDPRSRLILELFMHALVIVMIGVIFWFSFPVITLQLRGTMLSTGWSNAVSWFPVPIGMVLMAFYQITLVRRSIRLYQRAIEERGI